MTDLAAESLPEWIKVRQMNTPNSQGTPAPVSSLNTSQQLALDKICAMEPGEVVFLTGDAGTGKSFLVRYIDDLLQPIMTASTGLAAVNIGGVTCHSLFGIPMGIYTPQTPPFMTRDNREIVKAADYIVIDECSMLRSDTVDAIDHACRIATKSDLKFGGKKIIFVGDVFQLPPIVTSDEKKLFYERYESERFFDAWCIGGKLTKIVLKEPMRQSEPELLSALDDVKYGRVKGLGFFNRLNGKFPHPEAVVIVGKNDTARQENLRQLMALPGKQHTFVAEMTGNYRESDSPVETVLNLKEGAKVIICKNSPDYKNGEVGIVQTIANGMVSVIVNGRTVIVETSKWEKCDLRLSETGAIERVVTGTFTQVPLKLGYAITVHKSQGQTYDHVHIDLPYTFTPGQLYVALSRCKTIAGMSLKSRLQEKSLIVCPRVLDFMEVEA